MHVGECSLPPFRDYVYNQGMSRPLPAALHQKLTQLARRIRRAQLVRGVTWLLLAVLVTQALLFVADLVLGFEPRGFRLATLLLAGVALVTAVFGLGVVLLRALRPTFLAALVEQRYPELQEKVLTAVHLANQPQPASGAPTLVD